VEQVVPVIRHALAGMELDELLNACWSRPPFPKHGRLRLIDFPIEKFIIARPRVDLHPANFAAETTGVLVRMLLPSRGVRQPAIGTAKIFGGPYVACHPAIMRRAESLSSPEFCQDKRPRTQMLKALQKLDSAVLTRRILRPVLGKG
jgi:hypothetical protein